jgi:hypothetical protein
MSIIGHEIFIHIGVMYVEDVHNRGGGAQRGRRPVKLKESCIISLIIVHGNMLDGCRLRHPDRGP